MIKIKIIKIRSDQDLSSRDSARARRRSETMYSHELRRYVLRARAEEVVQP
jgi:hypothetical protein